MDPSEHVDVRGPCADERSSHDPARPGFRVLRVFPLRHFGALHRGTSYPDCLNGTGAQSDELAPSAVFARGQPQRLGRRGGVVRRRTILALLVLLIGVFALAAAGCGGGDDEGGGDTGGGGGGGRGGRGPPP